MLVSAARYGIAVGNAECFVTHEPCLTCTKLLMQSHVSRVVYFMTYGDEKTDAIRKEMRETAPNRVRFEQLLVPTELREEWETKLVQAQTVLRNHAIQMGVLPLPE